MNRSDETSHVTETKLNEFEESVHKAFLDDKFNHAQDRFKTSTQEFQ